MTIDERIKQKINQLAKDNDPLADIAAKLNERVDLLIADVKEHISEISHEMPEYDKHDATHSEAVLNIIEQLLQDSGVESLTLLEAITLRFCCYFHDAGMILPPFCMPLLQKVEENPKADPVDGLEEWLADQGKTYDAVKDLFLLPGTEDGYLDFIIQELEGYQNYCLGLEAAPENMTSSEYIAATRHKYLRNTHGKRSGIYAGHLDRQFEDVIYGSEQELTKIIGDICQAHQWDFKEVRELPAKLQLFSNCEDLTCNVYYMAMLLRMGDLLHFGPERASKTLYLEREKMNLESDLHWSTKRDTLGYQINPTDSGVDISYHGTFSEPQEYYFVQDHMNWVDEELICYETFRRDMEKQYGEDRYDLGFPEKVNREHTAARDFTPDQELKFKLEHQNIIELLMGARLYRDEFMCLRELYQNALDACRCMRAENMQKGLLGDLEIEFGLGNDIRGEHLYCKDQGTGMTMDIVKKYLLRIGNSYYKSADFRRANARLDNAVAPVSEFGIGLLSCYMIADRIEVITRHHTAAAGDKPIWISMESGDGYGYSRKTSRMQERELGEHGTIVKLYLQEKYKPMVTNEFPEYPEDVELIRRYSFGDKDKHPYLNSLYARIRRFVYVPEKGINLFVKAASNRLQLNGLDGCIDLNAKLPMLASNGISPASFIGRHIPDNRKLFGKRVNNGEAPTFADDFAKWRTCFDYIHCVAEDREEGASAGAYIHLPCDPMVEYTDDLMSSMDITYFGSRDPILIDGMPVFLENRYDHHEFDGIVYQFSGKIRPKLTVDRAEIRSIPPGVFELKKKVDSLLQGKLADQIRRHFALHPAALTESARKYLVNYLFDKFSESFAISLLRELARDLLGAYSYYGLPLSDWFSNEILELSTDFLCKENSYYSRGLAHDVLMTASEIYIEGEKLAIKKDGALLAESLSDDAYRYGLYVMAIKLDQWPDKYAQYDVASDFAGFVPSHVFSLIKDTNFDYFDEESPVSTIRKQVNRVKLLEYRDSFTVSMLDRLDPVSMELLGHREFIASLCEDEGSNCIRKAGCREGLSFVENGSKRYILYAYINPRTLTKEDEEYLSGFTHIPKYREGVEKGWSILFYNYENVYVIAPGIVDRMEMLKMLPKEARNHDDGLEYYFTDDTFAF